MHVKSVACEGYKVFSAMTEMDLSEITVIFGKNNSGKTTLARLPLFASSSLASESLISYRLNNLSFGNAFSEIANQESAHPALHISVSWRDDEQDTIEQLGVTLQQVMTPDGESVQPSLLAIDGAVEVRPGLVSATFDSPRDILLAALTDNEVNRNRLIEKTEALRHLAASIIHIYGSRPSIEPVYTRRVPDSWTVPEVPYLLASDSTLCERVSDWLTDNFDIPGISVDRTSFAFRLTSEHLWPPVNVASMGRGTQAIIHVATLLWAAAMGLTSAEMVIIEEPEVHLHPSAHAAIADLCLMVSETRQVIIDTHSENFILRLRRSIASNELDASSLALHYVDEQHILTRIEVDRFGGTTNWPSGVFESDIEEAEAIVEARLSSLRERSSER